MFQKYSKMLNLIILFLPRLCKENAVSYRPQLDSTKPNIRVIRALWPYMWPKDQPGLRARVGGAVLFMLLSKIAAVGIPIFYKGAVDALQGVPPEIVLPLGLLFAYGAARVAQALFSELKDALLAKVSYHAMRCVDMKVFQHLHQLGLQFHLSRKTGFLTRAIQRGVRAIDSILRFSTFNIFPIFIELALVLGILFVLFPPLYSIIMLMTFIVYVAYTLRITKWRTGILRAYNQAQDQAGTRAVDSLLNYETVKYFTNEDYEVQQLDQHLAQAQERGTRNMESLSLLNFGQQIIIALGVTTVMVLAAQGIVDQTLSLGDFVLVNTYMIQMALPLGFLGFAYREIKLALVDLEHMFALLYVDPDITDLPEAQILHLGGAQVDFEHVHFSYSPDREILKGVSFTVPAGQTVAIVGPSGAGKSTISRLLFRFYDPQVGRVLIDGQDIARVTQHSLRAAIGIVPQDTVLFNDTIGYNIAYGAPGAGTDAIVRAAKDAQIHDFIMSLPQQYETAVGERGLKLSGGEKQRVAIARTLLKKPAIFLFDEATSALDSHTEKDIQRSLNVLSAERTTLVIAHRLSTVVHAHEILVLDQGKIVERGTHVALLAQGGHYHSMWQQQQQEGAIV